MHDSPFRNYSIPEGVQKYTPDQGISPVEQTHI